MINAKTKLPNETKCPNCKVDFIPKPKERKYCKACDPNNTGKVTPVNPKKSDLIYEDFRSSVDRRVTELETTKDTLQKRIIELEKVNVDNIKMFEELNKKVAELEKRLSVLDA